VLNGETADGMADRMKLLDEIIDGAVDQPLNIWVMEKEHRELVEKVNQLPILPRRSLIRRHRLAACKPLHTPLTRPLRDVARWQP
jgi:hypothetical protein